MDLHSRSYPGEQSLTACGDLTCIFLGGRPRRRAEILFAAGIHPEVRGKDLSDAELERVWGFTAAQLRRGMETRGP